MNTYLIKFLKINTRTIEKIKIEADSKEEAIKECFYRYCLATYPSYWNIEDFKAYLDITHDLCYIDVVRIY